ncbi:MAG: hypothetical protein FJ030_15750 [Chloroflexi bacterium]|nr:hypothetical protein [Chloroflexota bacterium]
MDRERGRIANGGIGAGDGEAQRDCERTGELECECSVENCCKPNGNISTMSTPRRISVELGENSWKAIQELVRLGCSQRDKKWTSWGETVIATIQSQLDPIDEINFLLEDAASQSREEVDPHGALPLTRIRRERPTSRRDQSEDYEWRFRHGPDDYGGYKDEEGNVFIPGEGVLDRDEYRTYRRILDAQDGIVDDDD